MPSRCLHPRAVTTSNPADRTTLPNISRLSNRITTTRTSRSLRNRPWSRGPRRKLRRARPRPSPAPGDGSGRLGLSVPPPPNCCPSPERPVPRPSSAARMTFTPGPPRAYRHQKRPPPPTIRLGTNCPVTCPQASCRPRITTSRTWIRSGQGRRRCWPRKPRQMSQPTRSPRRSMNRPMRRTNRSSLTQGISGNTLRQSKQTRPKQTRPKQTMTTISSRQSTTRLPRWPNFTR